ncbi:MAG: class I SAM-dependent methyltransferase [Candidatus Aenigmatarchaeota archaeon]
MNKDRELYDRMVEESPTGYQYIYSKETLKLLNKIIPKNVKILDVGCGTGHIPKNLKKRKWYGVDISPKSLETVKREKIYKEVKLSDITKKIPYPKNYFDVVFALGIFHHIPDNIRESLREIRKVLKKDGILIVVDHNHNNLMIRKAHEGILKIVPCENERTVDEKYLMNIMIEEGFTSTNDVKYINIRGVQQALTPPLWKKIFKCPVLYLLGLVSFQPTDYMFKVRKK